MTFEKQEERNKYTKARDRSRAGDIATVDDIRKRQ